MNRSLLALALAFGVIPISAIAQDAGATPAPTDQQRQAMHQTFERFAQQEEQLHQQLRSQILSSLSPVHLRGVAATIGELAIAQQPDLRAAATRLDEMFSAGERQRILAAHEAFRTQSAALHEQMRTEMQSEMPAGQSDMMVHGPQNGAMQHPALDAGTIVLMTLSPHPLMEMMGMGWHGQTMHAEGPPPQ
jgi:hypothetical protein